MTDPNAEDLKTIEEIVRYTERTARECKRQLDPVTTARAAVDALDAARELAQIVRRLILSQDLKHKPAPGPIPVGMDRFVIYKEDLEYRPGLREQMQAEEERRVRVHVTRVNVARDAAHDWQRSRRILADDVRIRSERMGVVHEPGSPVFEALRRDSERTGAPGDRTDAQILLAECEALDRLEEINRSRPGDVEEGEG